MSAQRFTPEFEEEVVKQVRDRGYGVPDVAARLGAEGQWLRSAVAAAAGSRNRRCR